MQSNHFQYQYSLTFIGSGTKIRKGSVSPFKSPRWTSWRELLRRSLGVDVAVAGPLEFRGNGAGSHQNQGALKSGGERIELVGGANAAYPSSRYQVAVRSSEA